MTMRLLCIANPDAYQGNVTDIPLSYARLAAHPDVELFHADTRAMLSPGEQIRATHVPAGFMPDDFAQLHWRKSLAFAPEDFDIAFCRTLKPFPDRYLSHLQRWSRRLLFVNNPAGVERQLDPAFFLNAAGGFTPPVILTAEATTAAGFLAQHRIMVAKRANSCGGRGVYRISPTPGGYVSDNVIEGERRYPAFPELFAQLTRNGAEALLLMRYLPRVTEGDRRIIVVDGEIYGTYLRTSSDGKWVQNVSFGGGCELVPVEDQDRQIVDATQGPYRDAGIHVLGYDLLRDDNGKWRISEINAGNIGGLFRIEYLGVAGVTDRFVAWLRAYRDRNNGGQRRYPSPVTTYPS